MSIYNIMQISPRQDNGHFFSFPVHNKQTYLHYLDSRETCFIGHGSFPLPLCCASMCTCRRVLTFPGKVPMARWWQTHAGRGSAAMPSPPSLPSSQSRQCYSSQWGSRLEYSKQDLTFATACPGQELLLTNLDPIHLAWVLIRAESK